jgi:signal transduction histidine kinase
MIEHELFTPLAGIRGAAQLLQRRGAQPAWAVDAIVAQADVLAGRVRELVTALELEEGRRPLQPAPLALDALAAAAARAAQAQTARHAVAVETPDGPVAGVWDRDALALALGHLLANAVAYAPNGGAVRVRVERAGNLARVSVSDEGVGIPPGELAHIFDRFYRVDEPAVQGRQGLGLGLYLSRLVAAAHGGALAVTSTPGAGSTFTLSLPGVPA